jgi:hypothetical protein
MDNPDELQPQPPKMQGEVEIAHNHWTEYLDSFSREHMDWMVTVEVRSAEGRLMIVEERPLKGVSIDRANSLERAYVQVDDGAQAHVTHMVERPVRVIFKQSRAGEHQGLEIASANGTTTVIRFRSAMRPEALDGISAA